jgi:UDP-galactopyranose mutase
MLTKYDILIIGAGISGLTLAERYANLLNKKVLVIDKRDHIGGNCYDYTNEIGILVPKYGPHFFHTNNEEVWNYVSSFTKWHPYEHRVLGFVDNKLVPIPVNIATVNKLFDLDIKTEEEMNEFLANEVVQIENVRNSEESALSRVGKRLYELLFKNYTKKQWDQEPSELDASVLNRIPVRNNFDDRYFTDKFQAMPKDGYTKMFENMVSNPNIEIRLNTDYFDIKDAITFEKMFFTGPIDRFFDYVVGDKLQYRSLKFAFENHEIEYFQSKAQINFPNENEYTRITEPKHATGQIHNMTTIIKEFPTWEGEGYYPVPNKNNQEIYEKYQELAEKAEQDSIYFAGRLATYKYLNMDQAFQLALELFERLEQNELRNQ